MRVQTGRIKRTDMIAVAPKKRFSCKSSRGGYRRGSAASSFGFQLGIISCVLFLAMELITPGLISRAKENLSHLLLPAVSVALVPVDSVHKTVSGIRNMTDYHAQLQQLNDENQRLRSWIQTAMMLESENKRLRELTNISTRSNHDFITASILIDGSSSYARTLLIKTEQDKDVSKGQGVITDRGLVGRIIEANGDTARILLVDDINSRIPVVVEQTGDRAILAGQNDVHPALDHLPDHHQVRAGMRVVTSGHGGIFPYGVPVGVVRQERSGRYSVSLFVDPGKAHFVQVVNYDVDPATTGRSMASSGLGYKTVN